MHFILVSFGKALKESLTPLEGCQKSSPSSNTHVLSRALCSHDILAHPASLGSPLCCVRKMKLSGTALSCFFPSCLGFSFCSVLQHTLCQLALSLVSQPSFSVFVQSLCLTSVVLSCPYGVTKYLRTTLSQSLIHRANPRLSRPCTWKQTDKEKIQILHLHALENKSYIWPV